MENELEFLSEETSQARLSVAGYKKDNLEQIRSILNCSVSCAGVASCAVRALRRGHRQVYYSRSAKRYDVPRRYQNRLFTFKKVRAAVDTLADAGLITNHVVQPRNYGWSSWFETHSELDDAIGGLASGFKLKAPTIAETILLKDDDGYLTDYRDTAETRAMRADMIATNEGIASVSVLDRQGNDVSAPLVRIFKGSFDRFGRLYGAGDSWQNLKNRDGERLQVTIDGEAVHEVDYRSMAANMLRIERGLDALDDAYDFGDDWRHDVMDPETGEFADTGRSLIKIAFQIVLNSSGERKARTCISNHPTMMAFEPEASNMERMFVAGELIDQLKTVHAPVADRFFSGDCARLQKSDSDIATDVLKLCRKQGVIALPIHDSFLVQRSKVDILEEAMTKAAEMNGYGGLLFKRT